MPQRVYRGGQITPAVQQSVYDHCVAVQVKGERDASLKTGRTQAMPNFVSPHASFWKIA